MKKKKIFLAMLLSIAMAVTLIPVISFATEESLCIEQCATEIICVEVVSDQEYEEINIQNEAERMENELEKVKDSTDVEKREVLHDSLIKMAENENCYFLEEGVKYIEEYCPEIVDDIQTEEDLEDRCSNNEKNTISFDEAYAISTPDRTWEKDWNYAYSTVLGKLIKEKHTMKWVVKNSKIKNASTSMSNSYNKKYIRFGTYTTITKQITNNGQRARIQTKVKYTYIPTGGAIAHKVGAWMYNDGGCDFD